MKTIEEFKQIISTSYWRHIYRNTLIPFRKSLKRDIFLEQLYKNIRNQTYIPSEPRGYIVYNKHNNVARIVPAFSLEDNCFYYYTIKSLEKHLAVNHVDGTYGGFLLGNEIKNKEDEEFEDISSIPFSKSDFSYNRFAWVQAWREFCSKAYIYSRPKHLRHFVKFDIANFYDSINLDILEKKIRAVADTSLNDEVELLIYFLGYSNKKLNFYLKQTVSIPQDEVGDCSRLLSNFYLQEYDMYLHKFCMQNKSVYLRYADDQIIMTPNQNISHRILLYAAAQLSRINLNINSGKVEEYTSKKRFSYYWAFEIFDLLTDKKDQKRIKNGIKLYFERDKSKFRWYSVLKRLLYVDLSGIEYRLKTRLLVDFTKEDFLLDVDAGALLKIYELIDSEKDKSNFIDTLAELSEKTIFNKFHYTLLLAKKRGLPIIFSRKLRNRIKRLDMMLFGEGNIT